jgi:hypothetical protein
MTLLTFNRKVLGLLRAKMKIKICCFLGVIKDVAKKLQTRLVLGE